MVKLREFQNWFGWAVAPRREEPSPSARPLISSSEGLAVYENAYFERLLECLVDSYPNLARCLGDDEFRVLSAAYLKENPSRWRNVNEFGKNFPAFLGGVEAFREAGYLTELAHLERAVTVTLYTDPAPPLDPASLAEAPAEAWNDARLRFAPSLRVFEFEWPVDTLYAGGSDEGIAPEKTFVIVWNQRGNPKVESVKPAAVALLKSLRGGAPLGQALEGSPGEMQDLFGYWVAQGIVTGVAFA